MTKSPGAMSLATARTMIPEHVLRSSQDRDEQGPRASVPTVTDWNLRIITEVLNDPPRDDALLPHYKELCDDLTHTLREMRDSREFPSQEIIDNAYSKLVSNILQRNMTGTRTRGKRGRPYGRKSKRKKKRYLYARTQELYKKDPSVLAKYIRKGIPWTEDQGATLRQDRIKEFYTNLWGTAPAVYIPFDRASIYGTETPDEVIFRAITMQEIKGRYTRIHNGSAPGPDGIHKRHIENVAVQETHRLFFNLITICRSQPSG